jgi:hypothetical protein
VQVTSKDVKPKAWVKSILKKWHSPAISEQSTGCQLPWYSLHAASNVFTHFNLKPKEACDSNLGYLSIVGCGQWGQSYLA